MSQKHTLEELNNCSREELITFVLMMQGQLDALNENVEKLIEQVRIANNYRFGKHTETLSSIDGQLSFFDEAEAASDTNAPEPEPEDVLPKKNSKKTGQRNINLKDFPEEVIPPYSVTEEELDAFYGKTTGDVCLMKFTRDYAMSLNHGWLNCTLLKFMWEPMAITRMNFYVANVLRIFFAIVL